MRMKKIVAFLIICVCFASLVPTVVLATDSNIENIISQMDKVKEANPGSNSGIVKVLNIIIRLIQIAGTGISVIVVTILGVKYMLASSSEKADIKKMATPILIGCALLFAASNLVGIIATMGDGLNG